MGIYSRESIRPTVSSASLPISHKLEFGFKPVS